MAASNNRKVTSIRKLEGNRGRRPLPDDEPTPEKKMPDKSSAIDTQASRTWKKLAPIMLRLGLLTEVDGDSFSLLCQWQSRLCSFQKEYKQNTGRMNRIRKDLRLIDETMGKAEIKKETRDKLDELSELHSRQEYLLKEERMYANLYRQYAQEFGLTPKGRVGLSVSTDAGTPEGADLLS